MDMVVPYVENQMAKLGVKVHRRLALGVSLGGNLAHTVMMYPNFFNKAVLICPAISTIDILPKPADLDLFSNVLVRWVVNWAKTNPIEFRRMIFYKIRSSLLAQTKLGPHSSPLLIK